MTVPAIKEYMVGSPYTIQYDESASAAEKVMSAHRISHLPVLDGKQVIGIISQKDITLARAFHRGQAFDGKVLVKEISLFEHCIFEEETPLDVVARSMAKQHIDAVVIVRSGTPVGVFTTTDACRLLAYLFKSQEHQSLLSKLLGL